MPFYWLLWSMVLEYLASILFSYALPNCLQKWVTSLYLENESKEYWEDELWRIIRRYGIYGNGWKASVWKAKLRIPLEIVSYLLIPNTWSFRICWCKGKTTNLVGGCQNAYLWNRLISFIKHGALSAQCFDHQKASKYPVSPNREFPQRYFWHLPYSNIKALLWLALSGWCGHRTWCRCVVDFMLNNDGVSLSLDAFLFPSLWNTQPSRGHGEPHSLGSPVVYRETAFPSSPRAASWTEWATTLIVHDLKAIGLLCGYHQHLLIGHQKHDNALWDVQLRSSESNSSTEAKFFSHNRASWEWCKNCIIFSPRIISWSDKGKVTSSLQQPKCGIFCIMSSISIKWDASWKLFNCYCFTFIFLFTMTTQ